MPKNALLLRNPGMVQVVMFVVLTIVNAIVIILANNFFPTFVVLGTISVSVAWAIFLSSAALALIDTFTLPFLHEWEERRGRMLSPKEMMISYLIINTVGLWLVARAADVLGLGIASWLIVVVMAAIMDVLQGMAMVGLEKMRQGK